MSDNSEECSSIYDFTVKDTYGEDVCLDKYKGNVALIVNINSQCALANKNYTKLNDLKDKYNESGLQILLFPCNQFGGEMNEADGEEMINHLKSINVEFGDVYQKINVNGDNASPLYQFLKNKQTGTLGSAIKWNFTKFLIDKKGEPVDRFAPTTDPMDISSAIDKII